jgi:hypothetical protein
MQPSSGGGGLTRFHSTPVNWIESFILKEEEEVDERQQQQQDNLSFTQLLSNNAVAGSSNSDSHSQPYLSDYYYNSSTHTPTSVNASNNPFSQVATLLFFPFSPKYILILIVMHRHCIHLIKSHHNVSFIVLLYSHKCLYIII